MRNVPVPFTCDSINEVLFQVDKIRDEIDAGKLRALQVRFDTIESIMEELRSDNACLRGYAESYGNEVDEYEERVEELEDTLARKDERILALEEKLFDVEKEVADAQYLYQPIWSHGSGAG